MTNRFNAELPTTRALFMAALRDLPEDDVSVGYWLIDTHTSERYLLSMLEREVILRATTLTFRRTIKQVFLRQGTIGKANAYAFDIMGSAIVANRFDDPTQCNYL